MIKSGLYWESMKKEIKIEKNQSKKSAGMAFVVVNLGEKITSRNHKSIMSCCASFSLLLSREEMTSKGLKRRMKKEVETFCVI